MTGWMQRQRVNAPAVEDSLQPLRVGQADPGVQRVTQQHDLVVQFIQIWALRLVPV